MDIHLAAKSGDTDLLSRWIADGCQVNQYDDKGMTPLGYASQSPKASVEILKLLIDAGANPNDALAEGRKYPIGLAAASGSIPKVQFLLDVGANLRYESKSKYTILVDCIYGQHESEELASMIRFLHAKGASLDKPSEYGESPLSVASRFGRFHVVKLLLDLGADERPLGWSDLMKALVWGTTADFQAELQRTKDISHCDRCGRSAWHLAAFGPYLEKAKMLFHRGPDINTTVRDGTTALMLSAEHGNVEMLTWLISIGAKIEATDESGATALMIAARSSQVECARLLLEAGANPSHRDQYRNNVMSVTSNAKILRLLEDAGEDISDLSTESKRRLLGFKTQDALDCTAEDYRSGCYPRYGTANPELMEEPFWMAMVRCGCNAYRAREQFDPRDKMSRALWCFDRYGMSFTKLPDGRFVQIGGEHEDYYDRDFQIYNDVIVHSSNGTFKIYGYPKDVFPPTDFHSATLVDGVIYIIGGLGYAGTRRYGETPIYLLNTNLWSFEFIQAIGENPGWIYKHRCRLEGHTLVVSGGKVCKLKNGQESHEENTSEYELDLKSLNWTWKS